MGLYQMVKGLVPLHWKVGFHKHKSLPKDLVTRAKNRLEGQPPVPPWKLIYLVAGHGNPKSFLEGGRSASAAICAILAKNGLRIEQFESILDFGCGVGRIIRHWSKSLGPIYGTDYNPDLVEWCQNNLKFCNFNLNTLSGKLPYDSETFDFIYSFSVFTHLKEPLQLHWINELSRVLKPGGYIYITTHGEYFVSGLRLPEQEQFHSGQLVVRDGEESGSNTCVAFHPASYVRDTLARNLIVMDFIQCGAKGDSMHDAHLLRKPLSTSSTLENPQRMSPGS